MANLATPEIGIETAEASNNFFCKLTAMSNGFGGFQVYLQPDDGSEAKWYTVNPALHDAVAVAQTALTNKFAVWVTIASNQVTTLATYS